MRILAISDQVTPTLYSDNITQTVAPVDILLGCGDLPYTYMEYVVTRLRVKNAFFVHGNHDTPETLHNGQILQAPGGWQNVDRATFYVKEHDLIVAGLEGSIRYKPHVPYQYTESEMTLRAQKLVLRLMLNRVLYGRYMDIFVAHSPARDIHDGKDGAHRGFKVFVRILERFKPRLFVHGHKHQYGPGTWHTLYGATEVVNVHPFRVIQLREGAVVYGNPYR